MYLAAVWPLYQHSQDYRSSSGCNTQLNILISLEHDATICAH